LEGMNEKKKKFITVRNKALPQINITLKTERGQSRSKTSIGGGEGEGRKTIWRSFKQGSSHNTEEGGSTEIISIREGDGILNKSLILV